MLHSFNQLMAAHAKAFKSIVPFCPETDSIKKLDLSETNSQLTPEVFNDTTRFSDFITQQLQNARYGIGGYLENRTVYSRSRVFDGVNNEPRTLHLGVDIWGAANTAVMAPLAGSVHSKGYHPEYGNYGATLLLQHQIAGVVFYTLYGHLSKKDLEMEPGMAIDAGTPFAHFGVPEENGYWPPHLHFQVIIDLQAHKGDYPGVCSPSQRDFYQQNCPDPTLFLSHLIAHSS